MCVPDDVGVHLTGFWAVKNLWKATVSQIPLGNSSLKQISSRAFVMCIDISAIDMLDLSHHISSSAKASLIRLHRFL